MILLAKFLSLFKLSASKRAENRQPRFLPILLQVDEVNQDGVHDQKVLPRVNRHTHIIGIFINYVANILAKNWWVLGLIG